MNYVDAEHSSVELQYMLYRFSKDSSTVVASHAEAKEHGTYKEIELRN